MQPQQRKTLHQLPRSMVRDAIRPLLTGYERMGWSDATLFAHLNDFDMALADYQTCATCHATRIEEGRRGGVAVRDCRSSLGQGRYIGLCRAACFAYGVPAFGAIECGGPNEWLARQAQRMQTGPGWMPESMAPPARADDPPPAGSVQEAIKRWSGKFGVIQGGLSFDGRE